MCDSKEEGGQRCPSGAREALATAQKAFEAAPDARVTDKAWTDLVEANVAYASTIEGQQELRDKITALDAEGARWDRGPGNMSVSMLQDCADRGLELRERNAAVGAAATIDKARRLANDSYERRVSAKETAGETRSDAQGSIDAEDYMAGLIKSKDATERQKQMAWESYESRVRAKEAGGEDRSDAQASVDAENHLAAKGAAAVATMRSGNAVQVVTDKAVAKRDKAAPAVVSVTNSAGAPQQYALDPVTAARQKAVEALSGQRAEAMDKINADGGRSSFPALYDGQGNLVAAKWQSTRFGGSWGLLASDDPNSEITGWFTPSKDADPDKASAKNAAKGYTVGSVKALAGVRTVSAPNTVAGQKVGIYRADGGFSRNVEPIA